MDRAGECTCLKVRGTFVEFTDMRAQAIRVEANKID